MKSVNDNPIDPLGGLGAPIRPAALKPPETVKPFETGDWLPPGLKEKPAEPPADPMQQPIFCLADDELPDGLNRCADGRLTYRCPRCERHDAEFFGDTAADFDPTFPCGGSPWCMP